MKRDQQCEAFISPKLGGSRCQRAAKHRYETPGDALHVCEQHYHVLAHRRRLGSDEEFVRRYRARL